MSHTSLHLQRIRLNVATTSEIYILKCLSVRGIEIGLSNI